MEFRKGISIGLLALSLQPGCAYMAPPSVRKPTGEEAASVRSGEKAIVLLRLAPRLDNTPVTPLSKAYDASDGFWIFKADIDRRGKPEGSRLLLSTPSGDAAASNWAYLFLSPGAYWIGVLAPGEAVRPGGTIQLRGNRNVLEVPPGEPVVYAGTISVSCETVPELVFWRNIGRCGAMAVEDETEAAQEVARRDLGEERRVAKSLLRPQDSQRYPGPPGDIFPVGLLVEGAGELGTPDWKKRGVSRATGLGGLSGENVGNSMSGMGAGGGYLGAAIILGYALYLPFGTVGGYIAGSHSASKWGPCVDGLGARIVEWSPPSAIRESFRDALSRRGIGEVLPLDNASAASPGGGIPGVRTLLKVRILGVAFRECKTRWSFCPEMTIRARLEDSGTGRALFDETLVYSDPGAKGSFSLTVDRLPYEQAVYPGPNCLPIETYCGENGAAALLEGLGHAGKALAGRVVDDLLGAPGR